MSHSYWQKCRNFYLPGKEGSFKGGILKGLFLESCGTIWVTVLPFPVSLPWIPVVVFFCRKVPFLGVFMASPQSVVSPFKGSVVTEPEKQKSNFLSVRWAFIQWN
ncbi:uncharacterized protein Pyn_19474 [Prunus yedoensis var. nudiflora]|uniref:Uncharacterized protein n=1 Tax=Prunus yedoensis var. nudiflora TaxID=2094558 RepID=A0A314UB56_PRUYE|nr:uncharacterized protein Pyn_19474 [Prunus yedoensis var. nudiflora]